ncbi:hypothetical protein ACTXT7_008858 [Hymenolepis weldensis]
MARVWRVLGIAQDIASINNAFTVTAAVLTKLLSLRFALSQTNWLLVRLTRGLENCIRDSGPN